MRNKTKGLCNTCNFRETCVQQQKHGLPVLCCEEFDDFVKMSKMFPGQDSVLLSPEALNRSQKEHEAQQLYKGVCLNCDNRDLCDSQKTSSAVWQCNEYA